MKNLILFFAIFIFFGIGFSSESKAQSKLQYCKHTKFYEWSEVITQSDKFKSYCTTVYKDKKPFLYKEIKKKIKRGTGNFGTRSAKIISTKSLEKAIRESKLFDQTTDQVSVSNSDKDDNFFWKGKSVTRKDWCKRATDDGFSQTSDYYVRNCKEFNFQDPKTIKTYDWVAIASHHKAEKEFKAIKVSTKEHAIKIAMDKCNNWVVNTEYLNHCYIAKVFQENKLNYDYLALLPSNRVFYKSDDIERFYETLKYVEENALLDLTAKVFIKPNYSSKHNEHWDNKYPNYSTKNRSKAWAQGYDGSWAWATSYSSPLIAAKKALADCGNHLEKSKFRPNQCVLIKVNDKVLTYEEQNYYSEQIYKKPTLIATIIKNQNKNLYANNSTSSIETSNNDDKNQKEKVSKEISTNDWFKWVEIYPSALKDGTTLSASKTKGINIVKKINLDSKVYVPDAVNDHFKYFQAVKEEVNYNKYNGDDYKVLAAARNYYARFTLAGGYHKDLKKAVSLALKNCKKQMDNSYPLTECVVIKIGNEVITYKEQGYWSELVLKKPTLIKKYHDTVNPKNFDKEYLAKNFLNDQLSKFETDIKIVKKQQPDDKKVYEPSDAKEDKEAPIIKISKTITVNEPGYELAGEVEDASDKIFIEIDGKTILAKNGKFKVTRFSPIDEKIKITAIDKWGNKSEPTEVQVIVDINTTILAEKVEPLNPTKVKTKTDRNKVALIIGIENYKQTPTASFANLDAKYFYEYARNSFGVSKNNIKILVDEDANLIESLGTLNKWLPGKIKSNQTELIIFFAGHGLASNDGQELYLLPQDSDPDLLERTALSRNELFKTILELNPKKVTMFFDTCFSGISRDEKTLLASARPIRITADDQEDVPDNFTIFSASQLDQISSGLSEAKHGIFSYYLMKGLEGKADSNNDRKITNGELLSYLDDNISQKASELGRQQNPSLAGDPNQILSVY